MILTVTLNPAWDLTCVVDRLRPGTSHVIVATTRRAGGKGVNVASVLAEAGVPVTALIPLADDGPARDYAGDLIARAVPHRVVPSGTALRTSFTVVAEGVATVFNEPGAPVDPAVWDELVAAVESSAADVVAVSGSVPPQAPVDLASRLVGASGAALTVLDVRGAQLRRALSAAPDLVAPNAEEAIDAMGAGDAVTAAEQLVAAGARAALVSMGADGLVLVDATGARLRAVPLDPVDGNPTGAGDAVTAAVCRHLAGLGRLPSGEEWTALLTEAADWGAAAVGAPVAGTLAGDGPGHRGGVRVEVLR